VPFDVCVNSLAETDAPAGGSGGTAGAAGMGGTGGGPGGGASAGTGGSAGSGGPTVPPLQNGCPGYATRYWDCCKPHCGWSANAPSGPLAACDQSDNSLGGNYDAANACTGGTAFMCHSNAPWAVSDRLAYGFAAVAASSGSDICGKCYQLDFTGSSQNQSDPGSAALAGKTMIVQAVNIGGDVGGGQFDLAIPGGGVGAFNACSTQWGALPSSLGAQYGGFLADCKQQVSATDLQAIKTCVMQKCSSVFDQKGLTELADGCHWFVDWFQAADNPTLKYAEVACPSELMDRGMRRSGGGGGACLP
jgi:Glycosyl hydrolase family 45